MIYMMKKGKILYITISYRRFTWFWSKFFVICRGSWYDLYDEKGRKYKSLSSHIGEFISINSGGFSVKRGSWIDLYNQEGKK